MIKLSKQFKIFQMHEFLLSDFGKRFKNFVVFSDSEVKFIWVQMNNYCLLTPLPSDICSRGSNAQNINCDRNKHRLISCVQVHRN